MTGQNLSPPIFHKDSKISSKILIFVLLINLQVMKKLLTILFAVLTTAFTLVGQTKDWAGTDRYATANKSYTVAPKAVFMGDSITDNWSNRTDPDFFTDHNFAGRGISGQTSCEMLVRFRPDVIDLHPKYVVILAGTNDIAQNIGPVDLEVVLGNIQSMCQLAKANKIKPIICSVLPADKFGWRDNLKPAEDIVKLNEMLKAYAKSAKIKYVDYYSALADKKGGLPEKYAKDGVHPNLKGYQVMEKIILRYVK